jgi:hypothetical protein
MALTSAQPAPRRQSAWSPRRTSDTLGYVRRPNKKPLAGAAGVMLAAAALALLIPGGIFRTTSPAAGGAVTAEAAPGTFLETFDSGPGGPRPWQPNTWLNSNVSSVADPYSMPSTVLDHGPDCSAPPAVHTTGGDPNDAFFLCRDHVMTGGQESMRLTISPPVLLDTSQGEGVVRWDASTVGSSTRDWIEIWVVPFEDDFQITGDFERNPTRGIKIMSHLPVSTSERNSGWFGLSVVRDGKEAWSAPCCGPLLSTFAEPSAVRRDTFELRLSRTHLTFGMPAYNQQWANTDVPGGLIDWDRSLVYLQHAAYSPTKGGECPAARTDCAHNTWHWDNVQVSPAQPITVIGPDRRIADRGNDTLTFDRPAPAGSLLRFWSPLGWNSLDWSLDNGATWQRAAAYRADGAAEHGQAFKLPVPEGTRSVRFRNSGQSFKVMDARLVSLAAPEGAPAIENPAAEAPAASPDAVAGDAPADAAG